MVTGRALSSPSAKEENQISQPATPFADGQISHPAFIFRVLDCCTAGHSAQKAFWEMCPAPIWSSYVSHSAGYYPQCQSLCIPAPGLVWTLRWFPVLMSSFFSRTLPNWWRKQESGGCASVSFHVWSDHSRTCNHRKTRTHLVPTTTFNSPTFSSVTPLCHTDCN